MTSAGRQRMHSDLRLSWILNSISAPVCAANLAILPLIITNLLTCETSLRRQNDHDAAIRQLRYAREFFESLSTKGGKDVFFRLPRKARDLLGGNNADPLEIIVSHGQVTPDYAVSPV